MNKLIIDFEHIHDYQSLNKFLGDFLLSKNFINSEKYGYNLSAFWDMYGYSKDEDTFELRGYNAIDNAKFKEQVDSFIMVLDRFKGSEEVGGWIVPNPNFDYKIVN